MNSEFPFTRLRRNRRTEWSRRLVRSLAAKDWKQAAWSAGVLSHYYVDPIQPFHTHQTEEENV
ncbi:MAG TPA: hypothetical protein PLR25_28410, partial [Planctomycetaceae bacterium]|nr:hypothetical protein [Planctomycetaceae bacterium]